MTVDQQFTTLYDKLQQLLRQHHRLEKENEKLREELAEAATREAAVRGEAEEMQQQLAVMKLAAGHMNNKDKRVFERRLNQYIKEIDKTIAYLST